jgi:hypothetical protein
MSSTKRKKLGMEAMRSGWELRTEEYHERQAEVPDGRILQIGVECGCDGDTRRVKKLQIYLDTSVLGGCFEPEFAPWSNGLIADFHAGTSRGDHL